MPRRTVSALAGLASLVLAGLVAVLLSGWSEGRSVGHRDARRAALWSAGQLEGEAGKLLLETDFLVRSGPEDRLREAERRLESLDRGLAEFGRIVGLLQPDDASRLSGPLAAASTEANELMGQLRALAQTEADQPRLVQAMAAKAAGLAAALEELVANSRVLAQVAEARERQAMRWTGIQVALLGTILCGLLAALIVALWKELAKLAAAFGRQQRAGEELATELAAAKAGNREKTAFLATMSHEIRTPLNGMIGTLELLEEGELTPGQWRHLQVIRTCTESLMSLLRDLLDISRLETGRSEVQARPFALERVLHGVTDVLRGGAEEKGLALHEEADPLVVTSDPSRIRQILFNLVGNAVQNTRDGRITVTLRILDRVGETGMLRMTVDDTGMGIPEHARQAIFESGGGRLPAHGGMGLAICRKLVDALGGRVGFESAEGQGSSFWVEIPVTGVTEDRPEPGLERDVKTFPAQPGEGETRILIAEDNPVNQQVVTELLRRLGASVTVAPNGAEALEALGRQPFDLVFMDIQMPVMDGYEATRRIRSTYGNRKPIIVGLSASAFESDRQAAVAAGMNDFVIKPVNRRKLEDVLRVWLARPPVAPARMRA